jgi:hypothetical protein
MLRTRNVHFYDVEPGELFVYEDRLFTMGDPLFPEREDLAIRVGFRSDNGKWVMISCPETELFNKYCMVDQLC